MDQTGWPYKRACARDEGSVRVASIGGGGVGVTLGLVSRDVIGSIPMAVVFLAHQDLPSKQHFILNYNTYLIKWPVKPSYRFVKMLEGKKAATVTLCII